MNNNIELKQGNYVLAPKEEPKTKPATIEVDEPTLYDAAQELKELREETENQAAQLETLQKLVDSLKDTLEKGAEMRDLQKEFFELREKKVYAKAAETLQFMQPLETEFDKLVQAALMD